VPKVTSISASIPTTFFDELGALETLAEIAEPSGILVREDRIFAEPAINAATFPNSP